MHSFSTTEESVEPSQRMLIKFELTSFFLTVSSNIDVEQKLMKSLHADSFSYDFVLKNSTLLQFLYLEFMNEVCIRASSKSNMIGNMKKFLQALLLVFCEFSHVSYALPDWCVFCWYSFLFIFSPSFSVFSIFSNSSAFLCISVRECSDTALFLKLEQPTTKLAL